MWKKINIFNLEKKKIFSKIKIKKSFLKKIKKLSFKIKIYITGKGCKGIKYKIKKTKNIKNNNIILNINKKLILIDEISYIYVLGSLIKYKKNLYQKKIQIKHPNTISNCNCGESFNLI